MFNQNIISNKFDLNWSTTFSYNTAKDTWHNNTQHNDIKDNDTKDNDVQHNNDSLEHQ